MGLAHPHDGGGEADRTKFPGVSSPSSTGTNGLNQGIWTTMTYNSGWKSQPATSYSYGWEGSLMAFDIAALQKLYGANMNTATGNNTYKLPDTLGSGTYWSSIWDAGGSDTISNEGSVLASTINLNAAPLIGVNAGGYVSYAPGVPGGFTIANGVVIEIAIGGLGNDVLVGNAADNTLDGGPGADRMNGGMGNDSYYVDNALDTVIELRSAGVDTIFSTVSLTLAANVENLYLLGTGNTSGTGNALANRLVGNEGNNLLSGGNGNDVLIGNAGADTLTGGGGADTFVFRALSDMGVGFGRRDVITDFKASQGDRIDLSVIDAIAASSGDDAFVYIGAAAFSAAGQLRFENGLLSGEVTGDGVADFEIQLSGIRSFDVVAVLL